MMNLLGVLARVSPAVVQIAGLAALAVAAGLLWGAVGALVAAGVALIVVGVALERGE